MFLRSSGSRPVFFFTFVDTVASGIRWFLSAINSYKWLCCFAGFLSVSRKCDRIFLQRMFAPLTDHRRPSPPTSTHLPPGNRSEQPVGAGDAADPAPPAGGCFCQQQMARTSHDTFVCFFAAKSAGDKFSIIVKVIEPHYGNVKDICFYSESLRVMRI